MPPRFAYWTILAGGLPTAFRAAERDDLMPTFRRIKEKHPDAELKYYSGGKLWSSPADARLARQAQRDERAASPPRGREWRPGGEHRDPRQPFRDAKKAKNQGRRRQRWERKMEASSKRPPRSKPHGDKLPTRPFRPRTPRDQEKPPRPEPQPNPDYEAPPPPDRPREPRPRPSEPVIAPPVPERGRRKRG